MKITPVKDFLYALNGIHPTPFKKGVSVEVKDSVGEKLLKAVGYIEGGEEAPVEAPADSTPEGDQTPDTTPIALDQIDGMKNSYVKALAEAGIDSVEKLKELTVEQLADLDGISKKGAKGIINGLEKL